MTPEQRLKKIARIYERQRINKDNVVITTHLYFELLGAIFDLQHQKKADRVTLKTLNDVAKRVGQIGKLLPLEVNT